METGVTQAGGVRLKMLSIVSIFADGFSIYQQTPGYAGSLKNCYLG
jgi:hypothetical protein